MKRPQAKIKAKKIREGDFLPGLDNGYVFEDADESFSLSGRYNQRFGDGCVMVGFHTAEGDEAHLICPPDMPVTVEREGGFDDDEDDDEED